MGQTPKVLERDPRVNQVLSSFIETFRSLTRLDPADFNIVPLIGGRSAASLYRLDLRKESYVLRLLPKNADRYTQMHQISMAIQAGIIGVGPIIRFVDPHLDAIVMGLYPR